MAEVELRVSADLDQATREVAGFRKEYADLVRQVEKPLRQVNATRELEASLEATGKRVQQAKQRLGELQAELIRTDSPTERLKQSFKEAAAELQKLQRTEALQTNQLSRMRAELASAGVDTSRLAAEQRRLNAEMSKALGTGRADAAARGIRERAAALQQQAVAQRQANIEAARENLGVNRYRAVQAEIQRATQQYELLRRSGKLTAQELAVAQQQLTQRIRESKRELQGLAQEQSASGGAIAGIFAGAGARLGVAGGAAAGVAGVAFLATQYAAAVDPIKKIDAQLKLATESQDEFNRAQAEAFRIAQENQAPLADIATLYSRLAPALRDVGRGQGDAVSIIDAVTKSLRISGATAEETASTIQQFSQALGSGVLRGEEFSTLAESSPRLLKALADGLKVNVGALRELAAEGKLTADVIAEALIGQLPKLTAEAAQLPETFSGALTRMKNELQQFLKEVDSFTGASGAVIGAVNLLASGFGDLADAVKRVNSGEFGDFFRADKQSVEGINNEISGLLARVRDLQKVRGRLSKDDPNDTVLFKFKFYSKAELDAELKELEGHISKLKELRSGLAGSEQQELKDIKVQPTLDAEAQQALLDQMARLAEQAKIIMTIPVTYKQSDFDPVSGDYILQQPNLEPPGFADGGWTGPGGKYQPAGLVHRGEHVQPQEVVREPGALPFLEQIRRNGFRNTVSSLRDRLAAGLPGFAEGGLVGPRSLPAMPPIPQSLLQGGAGAESLGTLVLQLGGQQFSVQAPRSTAEELSRTARKLGATRR